MIRRLLLLLLLLQLGVALTLAWLLRPALGGALALLAGAGAVVALRLSLTAANFLLSRRANLAAPPLAPLQGLRMFGREFGATVLSSSWTMLRPLVPRCLPPGPAQPLPVLLIHGYGCNGGYWSRLSAMLARRGISHAALDLEPPLADIDAYAPQVQRAIEQLCARCASSQLIVVGHSMGGLVARAYLRRYGAARVAHVITLGTPHAGTALAGFGLGENARQMRRASAWLAGLAASDAGPRRQLFTSIYSRHDNIVAPAESSFLDGARNRAFSAVGHVALGRDPCILQCVLDEIELACGQRNPIDSSGLLR